MLFWDDTDPCNVFLDNISYTEDLANVDLIEGSVATTTIPMSTKDNNIRYIIIEEYDLQYEVAETMDNYQEWDYPLIILEDTSKNNESPKEHIKPDF